MRGLGASWEAMTRGVPSNGTLVRSVAGEPLALGRWSGCPDLNCTRSVSERRYVALEPSFIADVVHHRRSRSLFASGVRTYVRTLFVRRVSAQPVPWEFFVPLDDEPLGVATNRCVRRSLRRLLAVS